MGRGGGKEGSGKDGATEEKPRRTSALVEVTSIVPDLRCGALAFGERRGSLADVTGRGF